jgi:hypothetical protein
VSFVNPRTLIRDLAGAIISKERFARNGSGVLYAYRDGVYRPDGELLIRRRVKHLLLDYDCTEMWSRRLAGEIVEFIALDVPELPERPSTELINVENGFLNVRTRQLFAHSPDLLSTIRIPVTFDPQASCPEIERFLGEVFPEDAIPLAWEILGDLLTPDRSVQKAICLLGEGGNGKSVFLDLAARFIGQENVCHLSLQRLEVDRFSAARLYGKLANMRESSDYSRPLQGAIEERITFDSFGSYRGYARILSLVASHCLSCAIGARNSGSTNTCAGSPKTISTSNSPGVELGVTHAMPHFS